MKPIALLILFLIAGHFCISQVTSVNDTVLIAEIKNESELLDKTFFYSDNSRSLTIAEILQKPFQRFDAAYERIRVKPENINSTLYLKVLLKNHTDKTVSAYLDPGLFFTTYELYRINGQLAVKQDSSNAGNFKMITLDAGKTGYFLSKIKPLKTANGSINQLMVNAQYLDKHKQIIKKQKSEIQIFGLLLSGIMLMMIIFMMANFMISGKREFLYNTGYSICMFLLIYLNSTVTRQSTPFNTFYYAYFDFFLLVTGTVFYITFTRKFLDTKNNFVLLDQILQYGERFLLLLLGIFSYFNFFTDTFLPQYYLENIMKILFLMLGLAFIYLALKRKDRLFNYIAAGNSMLVLFSIISFILQFLSVKQTHFYNSSVFYYNLGIVLEVSFFLLGLTYKNRMELIKEIKKQEAFKLEAGKKDFENKLALITAQQEERNRISADMHDDLGAGMTTISLYSELAKGKLANNPLPEIDKISASANDLLNKMNAIIWSMNSSNDSLGNMIAYIRSYALEYFENTGIICKIDLPDNLPNIQVIGEIRRNVFLVIKEALNNILKHAKATEVSIKLLREGNGLTLYIQDNGSGIEMDKIRQFGNGLKNMKKRAEDIGIEFTIENKNGTLITMRRKVKQF